MMRSACLPGGVSGRRQPSQLVWVYDNKDVTGGGVIPAEMDNWQSVKQWSRFRSSDPAL